MLKTSHDLVIQRSEGEGHFCFFETLDEIEVAEDKCIFG